MSGDYMGGWSWVGMTLVVLVVLAVIVGLALSSRTRAPR
jgi:hypothetical protein